MDPLESIAQAAEREVLEETGVKAEFLCMMGLRETCNYRYDASDLYFGCILLSKESDNIDIQDTREVKNAKWIQLSAITHNNDAESAPYPLFPGAYAYMKEVQR